METVAQRKKYTRVATCTLLGCVAFLAFVYVGVAWFTADRLTRATNRPLAMDPYRLSPDVEAWSTCARPTD